MKTKYLKPLALTVLIPLTAQAYPELQWHDFRVSGGGDGERCYYNPSDPINSNVHLVTAGNEGSFLFQSFGISLPGGDANNSVLKQKSECQLDAFVTIPRGIYVQSLSQTICSAIIKSDNTEGRFSTNAYIFQNRFPISALDVRLYRNRVLHEPMICWSQDHHFSLHDAHRQCELTQNWPANTSFRFAINLQGERATPNHTFLLNVDSVDFQFNLNPVMARCDTLPPLPPGPPPRPGNGPEQPTRPVPTPTPLPPSTPPSENPTPTGAKLMATKRTALIPAQPPSCWINPGQTIFVEREPDMNRFSADVVLTQTPPNCSNLPAGTKIGIFPKDYRLRNR